MTSRRRRPEKWISKYLQTVCSDDSWLTWHYGFLDNGCVWFCGGSRTSEECLNISSVWNLSTKFLGFLTRALSPPQPPCQCSCLLRMIIDYPAYYQLNWASPPRRYIWRIYIENISCHWLAWPSPPPPQLLLLPLLDLCWWRSMELQK